MSENKESAKNSKSKWMIFGITSLANLVAAFSINSMNLALPTLALEFGVSQSQVSWLTLVYSLIPCCTLIIFGRLGDLYGYKRQLTIGFAFFGAVSLITPFIATSLKILIIMRCIQGLGYSMLMSITQAVVSRSFDATERGKALGVNSVFVSVGLAAGPTIGGVLIEYLSWKAIFWFNVPFCVIGILVTIAVLDDDTKNSASNRRMDWLGGLLFAVSVGAFVVGLTFSGTWGFLSASFIFCIALSIIALFLFVVAERKVDSPLMQLKLFKNKSFSLANGACVCNYCTQQMTTYLVPFYLVTILATSSDKSGLIMLASPLAMMLASPFGGSLSDKHGTRRPATMGLGLIVLGCIIMSTLQEHSGVGPVIGTLLLFGVGNGFSVSAINAAVFSAVPDKHSGIASSMVATMRNLGQALGIACGSVIISARQIIYSADTSLSPNQIYMTAQRDAFYFSIIITCLAIFLVTRIPVREKKEA